MEAPKRDVLERRLHALLADHLDALGNDNPDGFDLGVVAFVMEVITPDPENTFLRREEGGYTPAVDVTYYWSYFCSDHRWWVKKAVFAEANDYYQYPPLADDDKAEEADEEDDDA